MQCCNELKEESIKNHTWCIHVFISYTLVSEKTGGGRSENPSLREYGERLLVGIWACFKQLTLRRKAWLRVEWVSSSVSAGFIINGDSCSGKAQFHH